jgi:hypothetical protein
MILLKTECSMKPMTCFRYAVVALCLAATTGANAQTPEANCAKLLPAETLQAAVGKGMKPASASVKSLGELTCAWMRRAPDPFATVAIEFYEKKIIPSTGPDGKRTPEMLYEDMITPHETMGQTKREPIPGVNKRAVYVAAAPQGLVVVQRDEGVLRIVMNGLTKAQAAAIAKSVSVP